jgi:hypothetical protein
MRLIGNPNLVVGQRRAVAGMASFSGEGPFGAKCAACLCADDKSRRGGRYGLTGKCCKYSALIAARAVPRSA